MFYIRHDQNWRVILPAHTSDLGHPIDHASQDKVVRAWRHRTPKCVCISLFKFLLLESFINGPWIYKIQFNIVITSFEKLTFCFFFLFNFLFIAYIEKACSFLIFCFYFSRLKTHEISQQNMTNSENIGHLLLGTVQ